jgi:hypothetical protein
MLAPSTLSHPRVASVQTSQRATRGLCSRTRLVARMQMQRVQSKGEQRPGEQPGTSAVRALAMTTRTQSGELSWRHSGAATWCAGDGERVAMRRREVLGGAAGVAGVLVVGPAVPARAALVVRRISFRAAWWAACPQASLRARIRRLVWQHAPHPIRAASHLRSPIWVACWHLTAADAELCSEGL